VDTGGKGITARLKECRSESGYKFPGTGHAGFYNKNTAFPVKQRGEKPYPFFCRFRQGYRMGYPLNKLIKHIHRAYKFCGFAVYARSVNGTTDGFDLPGAGGSVFPAQDAKKFKPCLQYCGSLVKAAELQRQFTEIGPCYPEGGGKGKGARSQIRNSVACFKAQR
jgi:hypothetical protein